MPIKDEGRKSRRLKGERPFVGAIQTHSSGSARGTSMMLKNGVHWGRIVFNPERFGRSGGVYFK